MKRISLYFLRAMAAVMVIFLSRVLPTEAAIIVVSSTIQAAVDSANPGDTVLVPPGVYYESVLVDKDNITIKGSPASIIDAAGFTDGIRVGSGSISPGADGFPACPPLMVKNFKLVGLTIRNADGNGVYLIGVENYHITKGNYIDDHVYGIFPICTKNGRIDLNHVEGTIDAGIYVGESEKAIVAQNDVRRCLFGFEAENTIDVVVSQNRLIGNIAGVLTVLTPGLPKTRLEKVLIERNVIARNNLPNPFLPPPQGDNPAGTLPSGIGILNVGGDEIKIRQNLITGNNSLGLGIAGVPPLPPGQQDPRITDTKPDQNEARENVIVRNGSHPDTARTAIPGADIFYDGSGDGNCFSNNIFQKEFPERITEIFPCQ